MCQFIRGIRSPSQYCKLPVTRHHFFGHRDIFDRVERAPADARRAKNGDVFKEPRVLYLLLGLRMQFIMTHDHECV
jgi:hypothetical protein